MLTTPDKTKFIALIAPIQDEVAQGAEGDRRAAARPQPRNSAHRPRVDRLFARLERVLEPVLAGLLAFITIGVFIQVVLRYLFAMSFLWGEELSLFAFIWCVYLGTAISSWRHIHFSFDSSRRSSAAAPPACSGSWSMFCILAVTLVMVVTGWQFSQMSIARLSPALGITLFVPTIIIPVSGALMLVVSLVDIARDCHDLDRGAPARADDRPGLTLPCSRIR